MAKIGNSELDVFGLVLGGNVFGWTADADQSVAVLDTYTAAGGNFIDTADTYTSGQSETIIGEWLNQRGNRDEVVVATKVGLWKQRPGLSAKNIKEAAEDSLRRLKTDHIDLYYAHSDIGDVPLIETLTAFDSLVREGKVRYIAASNFTAERLSEALSISDSGGLARFVALQPHYNLVERDYEHELAPFVQKEDLASLPYFALARGFLTGKYRSANTATDSTTESPRAEKALAYLDSRGEKVLAALDEIAATHRTSVTAVSLAWLAAQRTVTAPIASARTPEQLKDLLASVKLTLSENERAELSLASQ